MWQSVLELDRWLMLQLFGGEQPGAFALALMIALTVIGRGYVLWLACAVSFWPQRFAPLWLTAERQRAVRELLLTLVVVAVSVYLLKAWVQRPRPYITLQLVALHGPPRDFSFPSGHAAGAFGCAVFLCARFALRPWHKALLLLTAFGIAISRCYLGAHWPTDILVGALLGTGLALAFAGTFRRREAARALAAAELANPQAPGA